MASKTDTCSSYIFLRSAGAVSTSTTLPPVLHHALLVPGHEISLFLPCNHELPQPRHCLSCRQLFTKSANTFRPVQSRRLRLRWRPPCGLGAAFRTSSPTASRVLFRFTLLSSATGLHAKMVLAMVDASVAVLLLRCDELIALCTFLRPDEECMHYSYPIQALRPRAPHASRPVRRSGLGIVSACRPRWS